MEVNNASKGGGWMELSVAEREGEMEAEPIDDDESPLNYGNGSSPSNNQTVPRWGG